MSFVQYLKEATVPASNGKPWKQALQKLFDDHLDEIIGDASFMSNQEIYVGLVKKASAEEKKILQQATATQINNHLSKLIDG